MALIFIAIPTSGTVTNGVMNEQFLKDLASLTLKFHEHTFVAPMVQDYALLKYMPSVETTWEVWGEHCRTLIERCDQVWVLQYDGWDTSTGVQGEIEHATLHSKPIIYVWMK